MEAANVIYFPDETGEIPVHYPLSGLTLSSINLPDILDGSLYRETSYRSHTVNFDYGNILLISQPTVGSCVHIIDGRQPLISMYDPVEVSLAAPSSNIENVVADAVPAVPQKFIFGSEPEHNWCYYFQKADLAVQLGDWETAAGLGDEAMRLRLSPEDRAEWMPFLKAYAVTGNAEQLEQLARRVIGERPLRLRVCEMLSNIEQPLSDDVRETIDVNYCKGSG